MEREEAIAHMREERRALAEEARALGRAQAEAWFTNKATHEEVIANRNMTRDARTRDALESYLLQVIDADELVDAPEISLAFNLGWQSRLEELANKCTCGRDALPHERHCLSCRMAISMASELFLAEVIGAVKVPTRPRFDSVEVVLPAGVTDDEVPHTFSSSVNDENGEVALRNHRGVDLITYRRDDIKRHPLAFMFVPN